ncbi:MAG: His-Xaa-Ser system radical SAM maturase HxsB, partial [Deltaproteobacteria bacterium]|nr:His-Xaa-Ser system radical SAM maturase HxsB [Deltaproteobacteria bacterium]
SLFLNKLDLARNILGPSGVDALMTTTAYSLNYLQDVINEYIRLGFNGIFIRSLNPYGFAAQDEATLGYSMESFVKNYLNTLDYLFELNRKIFFPELMATLLFTRILTPFATGFVDLQSPSGCGISGVIYDFDGSVFPSDEARMLARMGDRYFCLGNVCQDSFKSIFAGSKLKEITLRACVETTPGCAYCVYQAYCGTDPVRNYLETGDELRNMEGSPFCIKHKMIFDGLFSILAQNNEFKNNLIWSWINKNPSLVTHNADI